MNSALKNYAAYVNNKIDVCEISLNQYISTDNILQNKQGIECAASLPIQGGKVTAFKKGDILLANIRPYLKKIWYAQFDGGCSADVLAIRANAKIDSHFLFYALFRDDFFIHAMKGSKGTKMPRGDKTQIMEFKIPVFDPQTQQSIAAILSVLDKKIALNKQINTRLEEMAKTLYDYWFVQFDFPDTNGKPYKSSGGEMVFDETLKREIPKGWEVKSLGEVISLERGVTYSKDSICNDKNGTGVLRATNISGNNIDLNDLIYISGDVDTQQKLKPFDILIVMSSGSKEHIGKNGVYYFEQDNAFGAFCSKITPQKVFFEFVSIFLQSNNFRNYVKNQCLGTNINNLNNSHILHCPIVRPNDEYIEAFHKQIKLIYEKISCNVKQNHQLTQLRDFLLPMLMNGQVSVAE